uniref:Uncharacterized protein n=1 Tax=Gopherus agassizii TaxID=38772 RepID=A0A452HVU2_9SAUR
MIFWILAALSFIQAAEITENKILVEQPPRIMAANENATLACKYAYNGTGNEFRASLNKGTDRAVEVCSVSWNGSFHNHHTNKDFNCLVAVDSHKKEVNFSLWKLNTDQTDIYFCKIEVMFPPPYISNDKSNGTVIHVKGKTQNYNCPISFSLHVHLNALAHSIEDPCQAPNDNFSVKGKITLPPNNGSSNCHFHLLAIEFIEECWSKE